MNLFDKIIRLPNNLGKDIDIEMYSVISNTHDKIYGLSIYSRGAIEWKSYIGTLPFLYGILINLEYSNKVHDQMNNRLIKFKMDLDDDFHGAILFNLDINNNPINIIKSFKIIRDKWVNQVEELNKDKYITIKSYLYDQYDDGTEEYNRLPKLLF
jgi:hypothetical protein